MVIIYIILGFVFGFVVGIIIMFDKIKASIDLKALNTEAKRKVRERESNKIERRRLRRLKRQHDSSDIMDVVQGKC